MPISRYAWFCLLLAVVLGAYANHFHNSFHFDDAHTIESNVHIRSLANLPKFFTDPKTFSNLPTHQVYRPLLITSLAADYAWGGGAPFAFHVTSTAFFLLLIFAIWRLGAAAMRNEWLALAAAAVYGLHPVVAETVNYIIQRGDLLSTLGVVVAILLYVRLPNQRRRLLYLLPLAAALLVKPPALIFPVILFAWVVIFEHPGDWRRAGAAVIPSVALCAAMGWFLSSMTAGTFNPGGTSPALYRITQMYVSLYYFSAFFAPLHLTADSDWTALPGMDDPRAWAGAAFLLAVAAAIWFASQRRGWKPVAFGLAWFLAALFPTGWMPLAEVANDHRMFFPFVGLSMAVVCAAFELVSRLPRTQTMRWGAAAALCLVLVVEARATWVRNEVWRSEESLWRDAVQKSPGNGRALMNYALTLMARGAYIEALDYLERAHALLPNYSFLEINLGVAKGATGRPAEAEAHFRRAVQLEPRRYESHFFYARWLREQGRIAEASDHLRLAVELNPYALDAHRLYLQVLSDQRNWSELEKAAAETLRIAPADAEVLRLSALPRTAKDQLDRARQTATNQPTAENWLNYSLQLYQAGRFRECIDAARSALRLRPAYAEAWNNIAAGHNALQQWNEGISAANEALRLRPDFPLAANNRAWAISQLGAGQKR